MFQNILALFTRTFWHPFTDPRRATILIGSFFGLAGFWVINFISSYDFAAVSPAALTQYLAMQFGGLAVISGFLYLGFAALDGIPFRLGLMALLIAAFALFLNSPGTPLWQGATGALLSALYWGSLHVSMTHNTTDDNRGFEVALLSFMSLLGAVSAAIASASLLSAEKPLTGIIAACTCLIVGTGCMLATARIQPRIGARAYLSSIGGVLRDNRGFLKTMGIRSMFESSGHLTTALMSLLHFPAAMAATLITARVVLEFIFAPLIGKLAHNLSHGGYLAGIACMAGGWTGIAVNPHQPLWFLACLLVIGLGARLIAAGVSTAMYALKSYPAMFWTEAILGTGRLIFIFTMMPVLYYAPQFYAAAIACLALLMLFIGWRQGYLQRVKDTVHA